MERVLSVKELLSGLAENVVSMSKEVYHACRYDISAMSPEDKSRCRWNGFFDSLGVAGLPLFVIIMLAFIADVAMIDPTTPANTIALRVVKSLAEIGLACLLAVACDGDGYDGTWEDMVDEDHRMLTAQCITYLLACAATIVVIAVLLIVGNFVLKDSFLSLIPMVLIATIYIFAGYAVGYLYD